MSSRLCAWCVLAVACSAESVEPRAQTLLFIDTNALLLGQARQDSGLPSAVAIDTLRIDRLDRAGEPVETREFVVPEPRDWPVSFGIVSEGPVRFRLRAFRADNAHASEAGPLVPVHNLALDRLIEVAPRSDFRQARVVLDAGCFNAPASFGGRWTSCVDGEHLSEAPATGVEPIDGVPATRVGTSPLLVTTPCSGVVAPGRTCIPGGPGVLGDEELTIFTDGPGHQPSPARVMQLRPFYLDTTEVTVAEYRRLRMSRALTEQLPLVKSDVRGQTDCTFAGLANDQNDALPLNCLTYAAAREVCVAKGGQLPTEAQWEYAARGRGWARRFPWGSEPAACCTASLARISISNDGVQCTGAGIEPVGSHRSTPDCRHSDETRDGVLDMAGNVQEWLLDTFRAYDHECWATRGVARDPVCIDPRAFGHPERGSYFNAGLGTASLVLRSPGAVGDTLGIRCAYSAGEDE